jgi:SAM-dependent methyltransferase
MSPARRNLPPHPRDPSEVAIGAQRGSVREALKGCIAEFFSRYPLKGGWTLEVGSGRGFFYQSLPPSLRTGWIQLEKNSAFVRDAREASPAAAILCGSVESLPFRDGSCSVICGYTAFDSFFDLLPALSEVARVLRQGGAFFHLLDLEAHSNVVDSGPGEIYALERELEDGSGSGEAPVERRYRESHDRDREFERRVTEALRQTGFTGIESGVISSRLWTRRRDIHGASDAFLFKFEKGLLETHFPPRPLSPLLRPFLGSLFPYVLEVAQIRYLVARKT